MAVLSPRPVHVPYQGYRLHPGLIESLPGTDANLENRLVLANSTPMDQPDSGSHSLG
jgi:hypothetical protein